MTPEIRTKLHTLLDQMIDEDKYMGEIDEMTTKEEEGKYVYSITSYQITLGERKTTIY